MRRKMTVNVEEWMLKKAFRISREVKDRVPLIMVTIAEDGLIGRGEGAGMRYKGENIQRLEADATAMMATVEAGASRDDLQHDFKQGGAMNAVDCALWDLECKKAGRSIWDILDRQPHSVSTVYTIGIDEPAAMEAEARQHAPFKNLKVKVGLGDPIAQIAAVRQGAPDAGIIIDANQGWSIDELNAFAPKLAELGVLMIEQPLHHEDDSPLSGYTGPLPLCADESVDGIADLTRLKPLYQYINIKLDKTGGLTGALELSTAAKEMGFKLMVGNMIGTSLGMAPAFVIAQNCDFVDIDGPLLQRDDRDNAMRFDGGEVGVFSKELWG